MVVLVSLVFISVKGCMVPASGGKVYDLTSLASKKISKADASNEWLYTVSPCQNTVDCDTSCPQAGYCQFNQRFQNTIFCIGTFASAVEKDGGQGVSLTYSDIKDGRQGVVEITCDPTATEPANLVAISPSDKMGYKLTFSSAAACPVAAQSGLSGGSIFLIIFFVCIFIFLIGGVVYNHFVVHAEGAQLFNHLNYVKVGLGYSQDGVMFLVDKVRNRS
uniref:Autophagy-related protein 27 n=1 Tax=Arcella intermedia TaxID=1963864 RepID=A0A6B2LI72_9EUKA